MKNGKCCFAEVYDGCGKIEFSGLQRAHETMQQLLAHNRFWKPITAYICYATGGY